MDQPRRHHLSGVPEPQRSLGIERGYLISFQPTGAVFIKHLIIPDSEFFVKSKLTPTGEEITEWVGELKAKGADFFSRPCTCPACEKK